MNKDTLAPPIKQKARFKIKDAKCHLRPRNKEKHRESKQSLQGKALLTFKVLLDQQHIGSAFRRLPFTQNHSQSVFQLKMSYL